MPLPDILFTPGPGRSAVATPTRVWIDRTGTIRWIDQSHNDRASCPASLVPKEAAKGNKVGWQPSAAERAVARYLFDRSFHEIQKIFPTFQSSRTNHHGCRL